MRLRLVRHPGESRGLSEDKALERDVAGGRDVGRAQPD
jgi:hypothetical protein